MPAELDLVAIKGRIAMLDGKNTTETSDTSWFLMATRVVADVPLLVAEVERLRRLLGAEPFPTSDGYESAMQALTDARARVQALETVLAEVLRHFPSVFDADLRDSTRSGLVPEVTVVRWRQIAGVSDG